VRGDVRPNQILDKPADVTRANRGVEAFVYFFVDGDG